MRQILCALAVMVLAGCGSQKITMEQCDKTRSKFLKAYTRFYESGDADEIVYIFEEAGPVADFKASEVTEGYRFVMLPSFEHQVCISVIVNDNRAKLNLRVSEGVDRCYCEKLIRNETIVLSKQQVQSLREIVHANPFWLGNVSEKHGRDGADWAVAVKQQDAYYSAKEWCPEYGSAIRNIGQHLLELSGY